MHVLVRVVLGVIDGWDTVHILPAPGALEPALCGREPSLPWLRIWIDHVEDLGRVTGCTGCQAAFQARMVSIRRPAMA